jgi:DNA modification methylase
LEPPGEAPSEDPGPQIDRATELQAKWGTAAGQLWLIPSKATPGKVHKIACGDSTRAEDVARVMGGEKAGLCATDPPYLVDYTGDRPNDSGKDWTATYREIDVKDAYAFFLAVFTNVLQVLAPHAAVYAWHAHKRCGEIQRVWEELGILDHQQIVWVKPSPVFGRVFWHFRHEPCMMGWRRGSIPEHDCNQELNSVWEVDWEGKARVVGNDHPTQKPVEVFARPIRKHTRPGDVVFEPFCGSGSQVVAAE